jgi:uncharacterized membrane protein
LLRGGLPCLSNGTIYRVNRLCIPAACAVGFQKLAVYRQRRTVGLESIEIVITQPFKARTSEEFMALLGAVATAILASIIIITLYFGREIFVPIALAILLSFVLAPWLDYFSVCEYRGDWRS